MTAKLASDAQLVLDAVAASGGPPPSSLTVDTARERARAALVTKRAPLPLHTVEDRTLPTPHGPLGLRLYRPSSGRLPTALFLHGGGWTVNDLDTHDELCRRLAKRSGWLIVALDFRRAPEHRHPAQLEDAYLAYRWLLDNAAAIGADPAARGLIGESSGGATAAGLTVLLRDLGAPPPTYQVLAYPVTDAFDRWPSYGSRGSGYILDRPLMEWYFHHYLAAGSAVHERYLRPLSVEDLAGLPPTLVLTAEFDPLRDEGVAYAERLADAGVTVAHIHAADQMHGFYLYARVVPSAAALIDRTAAALARAAG
jgi:acetyl esterase